MHLVPRNRERIAADPFHVNRNLARGLHRVGVEIDIRLCSNLSNLLDRLHNSGFVVGHHDRNQLGLRPQSTPHIIGIDQPAGIHRQIRHLAAHILKMLTGM